jgi:uncharacterized phage protein gp47/JayE
MPSYIGPDDDPTDPDALAVAALDSLTEYIPGYVPDDNSLDSWLIVVLSRIAATNADVAKQMPLSAFRYFGETVIGLQPRDGLTAQATLTFTAQDAAGYTVPDGTNIGYQANGDTLVMFRTVGDVVIPPGQLSTPIGGVSIVADEPGSAGNGYTSSQIVLLDALTWVSSVTATSTTTGGADGETDAAYITRLSSQLQLYTPTPVLPDDFATMARSVPGVTRATGVPNYNPVNGTLNNERMVGVTCIDGSGQPVSAAVKANVQAYLQGLREINFVVNVFDPHYTAVNVTYSFTPFASTNPSTVLAAANSALTAFFNPATWGIDPSDDLGVTWEDSTLIYRSAVMATLLAVPGLRWVNTLTLNGSTSETLAISGPGSLPTAGQISGSIAT